MSKIELNFNKNTSFSFLDSVASVASKINGGYQAKVGKSTKDHKSWDAETEAQRQRLKANIYLAEKQKKKYTYFLGIHQIDSLSHIANHSFENRPQTCVRKTTKRVSS